MMKLTRAVAVAVLAAGGLAAARAQTDAGLTPDTDRARVAPASLDLRAAGLFRLSDGSLVLRAQGVEPLQGKNLRLLLDVDGTQKGLPGSGADFMLEGGLFYSYPDGGSGWSWDEVCAVAVVPDGPNGLAVLLPKLAAGSTFRWSVETLNAEWKTADRLPESGEVESVFDQLVELKPAPPAADTDVKDLLAQAPPALTVRLHRELADLPWEEDAAAAASAAKFTAPAVPEGLTALVVLRDAPSGETAELRPEKVYRSGARIRWNGTSLGVGWTLVFDRQPDGALRVAGELECPAERCLEVAVGCVLPPGEWVWYDDVLSARRVKTGEGRLQNVRPSPYGLRREQSVYPFGVVGSARGSVVVEVPADEPRVFQVSVDPETRFFGVSCALGLTPLTAKFPGRAAFAATLRGHGAAPGPAFRHALNEWYVREPARADRRVPPVAHWLKEFARPPLPDVGDAAPACVEYALAEALAGAPGGALVFGTLAPWFLDLPLPAGVPRTEAEALRLARFHAALDRGETGVAAIAALLGGARRADGALAVDFAGAGRETAARIGLSVDPEFMTTSSAPVNRAMTEWARARRFLAAPGVKGLAFDSLAGPATIDYNRAALAVADHPCSFTAADLRPGLAAPVALCEFLQPASAALRAQGRVVAAHEAAAQPYFPGAADVLIEDAPLGQPVAAAAAQRAALRALAGRKPVMLIATGDFEAAGPGAMKRHLENALFWGFLPGAGADAAGASYWDVPRRFERDRDLFRTWLPLARRLADAGWEPAGPVVVRSPAVQAEWFGRADAPVRHCTLRNTAASATTAELEIAGMTGPVMVVQPLSAACEILAPQSGRLTVRVPLAAGGVAVADVLPLSALDAEVHFMEGWNAGGGEAAACLKNLRSVRQELDAGLACAATCATPAIRGSRNAVALRVVNRGTHAVAISEVALQFAGRKRTLESEPRILGPGESAEYAGQFGEEDLSGSPWIEVQWRAQSGSNDWACVRAIRPMLVDAVEITARTKELVSVKPETVIELAVRNQSKLPRTLRFSWSGDFEGGRSELALGPESARALTLPVTGGRREATGRMTVRVADGPNEVYRADIGVSFLAEGASLARDSRARIETDGAAAGFPAEALADGVWVDPAGARAAYWCSGDSVSEHWIRVTLAEPVAVREVRLHWPAGRAASLMSRRGLVRGWSADGGALSLAEFTRDGIENQTTVSFEPAVLSVIEIRQPARGGPAAHPDRMCVSEVEIR